MHKLFISYSHADENYRVQLSNHLALMKREGLISEWHDRKLIAGQSWGSEIDKNLENSSIIVLLISSDFLASDYCYDVEMCRAMELHEQNLLKVIPIIIRSCDWARAPFSKIQGLPKDAKAIKKWEDEDEAWLDVANGIRKAIAAIPAKNLVTSSKAGAQSLSETFYEWLDDTEIVLAHHNKSCVKLSDIFVQADLKLIRNDNKKKIEVKSSVDYTSKKGFFLVCGEEQQGKTTLLKRLFLELYRSGNSPVYIDLSTVSSSDLEKSLSKSLKDQYLEGDSLGPSALLLDNISNLKLNEKARNSLLKQANEMFSHVVITCDRSFQYVAPEVPSLDEYAYAELLRFGHEKRSAIIEKWVSLGVEEQISEKDLYEKADDLKSRIDAIIRGNIVPAKPIYVLMIIQMFETYSQQKLELTSHGHCYQELIYTAFRRAGIPRADTEQYLNILTELAWAQYEKQGKLSAQELNIFFNNYESRYLSVERESAVAKLLSNSILIESDGHIGFKYPYLYYFFVAKKMAEGYLKDENIRVAVKNLLENLHREDFANILVFISHHTKDDWILEEIQLALMDLFNDQPESGLLSTDLEFMADFYKEIPAMIMEQREVSNERRAHHKRLDEIESNESDEEEDVGAPDLLAKMNRVFKGIEIVGQIIRNRHASLDRNTLYSLVEQGSGAGLRFLSFFVGLSGFIKTEMIKLIKRQLNKHPNLSDDELQRIAERLYSQLTYGVISAITKKIATSIGCKEATEIYEEHKLKVNKPAVMLLEIAISMHFCKETDISKIGGLYKSLNGNPVCQLILRELVIQHTYMFPVEYKKKQKLSGILGISIQAQRAMDNKTQLKA